MLFNPFRFINTADVQKKVNYLRRENPGLNDTELSSMIISERSFLCAVSGVLTTLPAIFPVLGTLFTLFMGIALDISLISYFMIRMIMELGIVNGRNSSQHGFTRETIWVFASAVGTNAVSKTINKISIYQMGNNAAVKLVQQVLLSLGIKSTPRIAVRIIPLVGAGIAGTINYYMCKKIGDRAVKYYQLNENEFKETININGDIIN
ncbi:MAG: EcsC family protein [Clostridiales bacterium]|nr:EcsC family protein [Clostridiales bacterium]MCF8021411.1 EcsC family protein [Clostridiales bacterium]